MSASECAGESGSERISSPARSATGSRCCSGKRSRYQVRRCTGRKWIEVEIRSSPSDALELVAREPEPLGVDADDVEVERVRVAWVARERLDPVEPGEAVVVELELALTAGGVLGELVELDERDRREHVREVRLVARHRDVVERAVAAPHQAQVPDRVGDGVVVRRDEPAFAGGDVLRRVEREAGRGREAAELAPAIGALGGVRRVLDHRDPELPDRVEVARLPGEVDRHDRLRPLRDGGCDGRRVDVQVALADVDEDRRRARVDDHVRGRRPGDRGRDHLVAGTDAERDEREVHRGGARRDGEHVLRLEVLGHPLLEQRRPRPGRQPARAERVGDGLDLLLADRGRLEAELCLSGHTTCEAYCAGRPASALERVVAALARREDRAGPVGAAQERPEAPAGRSVDPNLRDALDGLGLLHAFDGLQLPFGRDEEEDARAADQTLC